MSAWSDLAVLRVLRGSWYAAAFQADQVSLLARLFNGGHHDAYQLGLIFFGFGSTLFCYLWFASRYIPRALAGLGILASALVGICGFVFILFPNVEDTVSAWCYEPIFLFEVIIGVWLLVRRLKSPPQMPIEQTPRLHAGANLVSPPQ